MDKMRSIYGTGETWKGEGLKTAAEASLQTLGQTALGRKSLEYYAGGLHGRVEDERLITNVAGVVLENPVLVGAGWDKQARAIHGLHSLGFSGVEVGTVTPEAQYGGEKPRLFMIDKSHSVALNRMQFNSPGADRVEQNLDRGQPYPCRIGINVGRNKWMTNQEAPAAHEAVIQKLGRFADYIVLGISSPNTPDLRGLQDKAPLRELIQSAQAAMPVPVPLFVKIDAERTDGELHDMIQVGLEEGLAGFVATNTYKGGDLKAAYGQRWANEAGGLSGADVRFQVLSTRAIRRIYEEAGDLLTIIGAGGVGDGRTAFDKIMAGASAVQVVTAMRPSWGRVAARTNRGLIVFMEHMGASNIQELIGLGTSRGAVGTKSS